MSRINLDMHINDALFAMSGGNPGAVTVMADAYREGTRIDPQGMGGWGFILNLDELEVYDHLIWRLYKDLCGESIARSMALVRSVQMGVLSREKFQEALEKKTTLDIDEVLGGLKERLPSFQV